MNIKLEQLKLTLLFLCLCFHSFVVSNEFKDTQFVLEDIRPKENNVRHARAVSRVLQTSRNEPAGCIDPYGRKGTCKVQSSCKKYSVIQFRFLNQAKFECTFINKEGQSIKGLCCAKPSTIIFSHAQKLQHQTDKPPSTPPTTPRPTSSANCKFEPIKKISERGREYQISKKLVQNSVDTALKNAQTALNKIKLQERSLLRRHIVVQRNTPEEGQLLFTVISEAVSKEATKGDVILLTSIDLSDKLDLSIKQKLVGLKTFTTAVLPALRPFCPQPPFVCNRQSKYRTINGSCNNILEGKSKLGMTTTPFMRLLTPAYSDGVGAPKVSTDCSPLPNARLLSRVFNTDVDSPSTRHSLFVMQFGQFLAHDITATSSHHLDDGNGITCCTDKRMMNKTDLHIHCLPIEIAADDPVYGPVGQTCMNFVRNRWGTRIDCSVGYADQLNGVSHWIDASNVYGSENDDANDLRLMTNGLLKFSLGPETQNSPTEPVFLPRQPEVEVGCSWEPELRSLCALAGDRRVNEMLGLKTTHLVWFREHNRIAKKLFELNPHLSDEKLYQESRRILIAEYQHIIYNEYLPILIGTTFMDSKNIFPLKSGFYQGYNPEVDASMSNEFGVAAFRMGHALVQGIVELFDSFGNSIHNSTISTTFSQPDDIRVGDGVDHWIRGLTRVPIQNFNRHVTSHVAGHLFQTQGTVGMDLSALNIQRGRDHGIPGYNMYREFCGKSRATTFDGFNDTIPKELIELMKLHYKHVDDVDLWIGGLSEIPKAGALVGPTYACILGNQFMRSKQGDRYFYENGNTRHSFTSAQLTEIRKTTFSRILCDNGDHIPEMQPAAFFLPNSDNNTIIDCTHSSIPTVNLGLWRNIQ